MVNQVIAFAVVKLVWGPLSFVQSHTNPTVTFNKGEGATPLLSLERVKHTHVLSVQDHDEMSSVASLFCVLGRKEYHHHILFRSLNLLSMQDLIRVGINSTLWWCVVCECCYVVWCTAAPSYRYLLGQSDPLCCVWLWAWMIINVLV